MTAARQFQRARERRPHGQRIGACAVLCGALLLIGVFPGTRAAETVVRLHTRDGTTVSGTTYVTAHVRSDARVVYVIFRVNGEGWAATNRRPYELELDTTAFPNGPVEVVAEAYTRGALLARSAPLVLTVLNSMAPKPEPRAEEAEQQSQPESVKGSDAPAQPRQDTRSVRPPGFEPTARLADGALPGAALSVAVGTAGSPNGAERVVAQARAPVSPHTAAADTGTPAPQLAVTAGGAPRSAPVVVDGTTAVQPAMASPVEGGLVAAVLVNGEPYPLGAAYHLRDGRVFIGFRALMERLDARVGWEHTSKRAWAEWQAQRVALTIGSPVVTVDGVPYSLGADAVILKDNRTLVPLRRFGEALGFEVRWIASRRQVWVRTSGWSWRTPGQAHHDTAAHAEVVALP